MKEEKKAEKLTNYPPLEGPMNMLGLIITDPQGSYTGRPTEKDEIPVQDADDL